MTVTRIAIPVCNDGLRESTDRLTQALVEHLREQVGIPVCVLTADDLWYILAYQLLVHEQATKRQSSRGRAASQGDGIGSITAAALYDHLPRKMCWVDRDNLEYPGLATATQSLAEELEKRADQSLLDRFRVSLVSGLDGVMVSDTVVTKFPVRVYYGPLPEDPVGVFRTGGYTLHITPTGTVQGDLESLLAGLSEIHWYDTVACHLRGWAFKSDAARAKAEQAVAAAIAGQPPYPECPAWVVRNAPCTLDLDSPHLIGLAQALEGLRVDPSIPLEQLPRVLADRDIRVLGEELTGGRVMVARDHGLGATLIPLTVILPQEV